MEPFLKWAGGKRWLLPRIIGKVPPFHAYYEPFLGSGGLFFSLEPEQAVLSDTNAELINCYRCVRDHCSSVIKVLKRLRIDKKTYYRIRNKQYHKAEKIKRAAFFIYLNKTCWNGLYRVNKEGRFNVPAGTLGRVEKIFDEEQLISVSCLLRRARLKCCDFEEAVQDARAGDLVYFDPPYITTHLKNGFVKYNSKLFSQSDELRLSKVAEKLAASNVSVIVSNAAHPLIKEQYDGPFYKTELGRASLIAADPEKRRRFTELLVTSFPVSL